MKKEIGRTDPFEQVDGRRDMRADLEAHQLRVMDPELGEGWTREYARVSNARTGPILTMLVKHPQDVEDIVVSKDVTSSGIPTFCTR